ncbi:Zinc finger protein 280D [Merluccius polli]|uniref:Zinc finger protein 280D n=1 Tax=Merluccius polli TaxID=89951 RepID=A0AA47MB66_MERPO|nr:Zinc finger protein 280D [Merluccius polli]
MSELFMECEEEELEPWQKQVPEVNLLDDDDDDEPIFIGELVKYPKIVKPSPPPVRNDVPRQEPQPQPPREATPVTIIPANKQMPASSSLTTITPQPVIINSQGFIVQQPQLSSTNLIATLGKQYPPGTSFTIVPAGQQHLLPLLPQARILPGVVHRPQVKLNNNVVTLSNVQSPAVYSSSIPQPSSIQPKPIQIFSIPVKSQTEGKGDQASLKRGLLPKQNEVTAKKVKLDPGQQNKVMDVVDSVIFKKKCPKCKEKFPQDTLRSHTMSCHANLVESVLPSTPNKTLPTNKHILLVNEFYYGRVEGNWQMQRPEHKTNTTFKCQSCLKVLKNNIRFMNHMKHHLELEKQCSESWESHTTCQHCYRQYLTPFQLQCHVERAHSLLASSTNCKICELAFETEQVLLEHMKDTHKPGEMPYMCQVCNFRSSFFMEVEAHFKVAHNNTKDLLCPFCLKVLRSGHSYMQHYMKHQKKGIHRCGKCRLNFLTYKERVDHKINYHKTFKKPKALDGLPPGTKVTIRASLSGNVASYNPSPSGLAHEAKNPKPAKSKPNPSQVLGKDKPTQPKKQQEKRASKKNLALKNTRIGGGPHTCIECSTEIKDFFSHYPMISNCGACNYQTSCKVSISNHMIRYHSTISKDRFRKMGNQRNPNPSIRALTCLNCRFLVGALQGDKMSKHLIENPHHMCRVIQPKGILLISNCTMRSVLAPSSVFYLFTSTTTTAEKPKEVDTKQSPGNGASVSLQEEASVQLAGANGDKEAGANGDKEAGANGDKEAGATGDKEAGANGDKEAGATGDKEAGATGDKEAKEAPPASSADASFPPLSPLVGTLEEGSAVLDDLLDSHVGIDQVRELVSSLQEDLISSAQKTQTEVQSLSNQGMPASSLNIAHDVPE